MDVMTKAVRFDRRCLRCTKKFRAVGKFNRVCPECAVKNLSVSRIELARNGLHDNGEPTHNGRRIKKRVRSV